MDRKAWLWFYLNQVTGSQVTVFEHILARFPDIEALYHAAKSRDTVLSPLGQTIMNKLHELADDTLIDTRLEWLHTQKIQIIPCYSEAYPTLLKEIRHPPSVLYVKGRLHASPPLPIAMVGMRRHTAYGEAVATHLASELVKNGAVIVSGMALGIDACAARAALAEQHAEYPTVAVLGSGLDVVYPPENARLYDEIAERGAVVSEFLAGTRPFRENFPLRNRVISGLARGVVVVEAGERSGTTITAGHALDQGRDVFAVPGRITDATSMGPNGMIQRGEAKPVFCAADILLEYGVNPDERIHKQEPPDMEGLSPVEKEIVRRLAQGKSSADELCDMLSLDAAEVNSGLTSLLFSGIIKQLPGRLFSL